MADSKMYAKSSGEWVPVYPEPERGVAPVLSAAPEATQIVYTWTAATGVTPASYELDFNGVIENVGNVLTFTKTGLTTGQSYTARVRAKTAENVRGEWSNLLNTVAAVPFNAATGGTETTIPNYNGSGETWKVHTFTANGTLTITKAVQPFRVFLNGGGGGGGAMDGNWHGCGGNGGYDTQDDDATIPVGDHAVVIGAGGGTPYEGTWSSGGVGGVSSLGSLFTANGGEGGTPPGGNNGNYWSGTSNGGTTNIRGTSESFGNGGPADAPPWYPSAGVNTGNGGSGSHTGRGDPSGPRGGVPGAAGIVVVAYRIG